MTTEPDEEDGVAVLEEGSAVAESDVAEDGEEGEVGVEWVVVY